LRHRHQHLAEIFCLRELWGVKLNAGELAHTVDQNRNFFAELFAELCARNPSIFDYVMQNCGGQGCSIDM